MKPLTTSEKKKITEQLNNQFGIKEINAQLFLFGKEKIRLYTGALSREELIQMDKELRIENIGLYFAKQENDGFRLTLDGVQLFKREITKNIIELNDIQAKEWLKGYELDIKTDRGWKILKHKNEFLGCGKSTEQKITNFVPKERRIK